MNFKNKLARFMWGRNGIDALYYFQFVLFMLLWILQYIVRSDLAKALISIASLILAGIMIFRFMSKDLVRRRKENQKFLGIWKGIKGFFLLQKNKIRDFKKFVYKKCPHCKANLRLPRKKGTHSVVCPRCKKRFEVKNLF